MSFVPGYEHDVFISYASVDNQPPEGVQQGWVTTLTNGLERVLAEELGKRGLAKVWMDRQLQANDVLTPTLLQALDQSATLLIFLSPGYLESEWCARERNAFLRQAQQITAQGQGRIFLVEKRQIDWDQKPAEIRDIKGKAFWVKEADRVITLGDPMPRGEEVEYYRRVNDLGRELADQLKRMRATAGQQLPAGDAESARQVLLADVTDDLVDQREEVKRYLQQQGIGVIDRYYSSEPDEFRGQLRADLQQSQLFVQLLSAVTGRRPPGAENGYPELQFEVASQQGAEILQWHAPGLIVDDLADGPQKRLLLQPSVISEPFEQFKSRVAEAAIRKPEPPKEVHNESLLFLNYSHDDEEFADKVREWIDRQGFGYLLPMTSGQPDENREALKTNVQESDAMLILYGRATEAWVRGQLLQFRKFKGSQQKGLAIFEGPPPEKPTVGMKLPGMQILNCRKAIDWQQVEGFLNKYAAVTGNA
jgi:hypothetical protein